MIHRICRTAALIIAPLLLVSSSGCFATLSGPNLGLMSIPIPVSPYFQKLEEDKYWNHLRYERSPVLGPLVAGAPDTGLDVPSDDEVMRALEKARPVQGGIPWLYELSRSRVRIVKELINDSVDPPRVNPLVGPVQLHHVKFKCIVYFTETTRVGWPLPYTTMDEEGQEVVYIDHSHLHAVGNVDYGPGSSY